MRRSAGDSTTQIPCAFEVSYEPGTSELSVSKRERDSWRGTTRTRVGAQDFIESDQI